jgi:hypothetical protein
MADVKQALIGLGYRLVEDAWYVRGRRTYMHDDETSRPHLAALRNPLGALGWSTDRNKLRSFRHPAGEEIEIEPGGADTSGHFLHHMKPVTS